MPLNPISKATVPSFNPSDQKSWFNSFFPKNSEETTTKVIIIAGLLFFTIGTYFYLRTPKTSNPTLPPTRTPKAKQRLEFLQSPHYIPSNNSPAPFPIPFSSNEATPSILKLRHKSFQSPALKSNTKLFSPLRKKAPVSQPSTPLSSNQISIPAQPSTDQCSQILPLMGYFILLSRTAGNQLLEVLGLRNQIFDKQDAFKLYKSIDIESIDIDEDYKLRFQGAYNNVSALENIPSINVPNPITFERNGWSTVFEWGEVFEALAFFEIIAAEKDEDRLKDLLIYQPVFCDSPLLIFFMENLSDLQSENPWEELIFSNLRLAYIKTHAKVMQLKLFDDAYPGFAPISQDFTPPMTPSTPNQLRTPRTPGSQTVQIPLAPLENAALKWAENPVIQWVVYHVCYEEEDYKAFSTTSNDEYLKNFQKLILHLYFNCKTETVLSDKEKETLRKRALSHLQQLQDSIDNIKGDDEQTMKKNYLALKDEKKSHLFESYLFINALRTMAPKSLHDLNPDWQTKMSTTLRKLEENHIKLVPNWNPDIKTDS